MQDYISSELSHFVGRSKESDYERMQLLKLIISGGKLIANINNQDNPAIQSHNMYRADRLGEIFEQNDVVCFCDIPRESLKIHTSKYSEFGISFNKNFVAERGGRPVTYIPSNYDIHEKSTTNNPKKPSDYFTTISRESITLSSMLMLFNQLFDFRENLKKVKSILPANAMGVFDQNTINKIEKGEIQSMMFSLQIAVTTMLAFIKLFDCELENFDEDNYYMEREWRILNNLEFNITDIKCVFLPHKKYKEDFLNKFPTYKGDFHIFS